MKGKTDEKKNKKRKKKKRKKKKNKADCPKSRAVNRQTDTS